jgi:hypothetical protein
MNHLFSVNSGRVNKMGKLEPQALHPQPSMPSYPIE